jgi:hypothetical protein
MQLQELMAFFKVDANATPTTTRAPAVARTTPKRTALPHPQKKEAPGETGFVKF